MAEAALKREGMSYSEYLEVEAGAEERHNFWDGEMFAMSGGSFDHTILETNLIVAIQGSLKGRPCQGFTGNRRLRALNSDRAVYPDAVVICGKPQAHPEDPQAASNPSAVFEVLSPSTEAFDRGKKFRYYQEFESLTHIVLLSQDEARLELFSRGPGLSWTLSAVGAGQSLELPDLGLSLSVDALYERTGQDKTAAPEPSGQG